MQKDNVANIKNVCRDAYRSDTQRDKINALIEDKFTRNLEKCITALRDLYLKQVPVVVLGSGLSCAYNFSSMSGLRERILEKLYKNGNTVADQMKYLQELPNEGEGPIIYRTSYPFNEDFKKFKDEYKIDASKINYIDFEKSVNSNYNPTSDFYLLSEAAGCENKQRMGGDERFDSIMQSEISSDFYPITKTDIISKSLSSDADADVKNTRKCEINSAENFIFADELRAKVIYSEQQMPLLVQPHTNKQNLYCISLYRLLRMANTAKYFGPYETLKYFVQNEKHLNYTFFDAEDISDDSWDSENEIYKFTQYLSVHPDLEKSIDDNNLDKFARQIIQLIIWQKILEEDKLYFKRCLVNNTRALLVYDNKDIDNKFEFSSEFIRTHPLCCLIKKLQSSNNNALVIVTTNYDHVAEHEISLARKRCINGFTNAHVGISFLDNLQMNFSAFFNNHPDLVMLFKVHGSLDWFRRAANFHEEAFEVKNYDFNPLELVSLRLQPLIVPPCRDKHEYTHFEPFRSLMYLSDIAFTEANNFLCIGYGFNDAHIQDRLLKQIRSGKPCVILSKSLSENCRRELSHKSVDLCYLAFEQITLIDFSFLPKEDFLEDYYTKDGQCLKELYEKNRSSINNVDSDSCKLFSFEAVKFIQDLIDSNRSISSNDAGFPQDINPSDFFDCLCDPKQPEFFLKDLHDPKITDAFAKTAIELGLNIEPQERTFQRVSGRCVRLTIVRSSDEDLDGLLLKGDYWNLADFYLRLL